VPFIARNLCPFYWGPKATSRRPPQPEMAVCVRGTFRLQPGQPLEAIEDPMDQGFMSGDTWDLEDIDRLGPLTYSSDFADWKPRADLLLTGTCHPPRGADVTCSVRFAVGSWSKSLRVTGPRTFKPGLLLGGALSDPQPFTHMPLTWENAYGGAGYARNPVGRGYATNEAPTVEHPAHLMRKKGQKRVLPGCFGPISPQWAPRNQRLGKKWGKSWEKHRKPFYAEDFDWAHFNAAPEDQQLEGYLRGDEEVVFENLHPQERVWTTRLPGLRIRAFIKDPQGRIHDVQMALDTLYADLDAGRLYLTWRGHIPIARIDLTENGFVVIDREPLAEPPRPREFYERHLAELEADPLQVKHKLPPGFLEMTAAMEQVEVAARDGKPLPDLKKLAASIPAGCPFPPWFLAVAAGSTDPFDTKSKLPPELFGADPAGVKARLGELADLDPKRLEAALKPAQADPANTADALEAAAEHLPAEQAEGLRKAAASVREGTSKAQQAGPEAAAAMSKPAPAGPPPQQPGDALKGALEPPPELAQLQGVEGGPEAAAKVTQGLASVPSLDEVVGQVLKPLDDVELPEVEIPDVEAVLAKNKAKLTAIESRMAARGIESPMFALFAFGRRLIDKAPRPGTIPGPDLTPLTDGLTKAKDGLLSLGVSAAAVAPLTGLLGRLDDLIAKLPPVPPKPPEVDYAYQELSGQDLSGQDLRGLSFARADLSGADLSRSDLSGADLTEAVLIGANLEGARLPQAVLARADLKGARLVGADVRGADGRRAKLVEADVSGASFAGANLEDADFTDAVGPQVSFQQANLSDGFIAGATFERADFRGARMEQLKGLQAGLAGASFAGADVRFAMLSKADLRAADFTGADLSVANLSKVKADGADFSRAKLDVTDLSMSRLHGAKFLGATSSMGNLIKANLEGADLRGARFEKVNMIGAAFDRTDWSEATLRGMIWRDVQAEGARFVKADIAESHVTGSSTLKGCNFALTRADRTVWMEADLTGSDFAHASLKDSFFQFAQGADVNFFAATLKGAGFRHARWTRTRFVGADLCGADFCESYLLDTQFTKANCYDAKFLQAKLASCDFLEANLNLARFEKAEGAPE